jgi:hypothetical protein
MAVQLRVKETPRALTKICAQGTGAVKYLGFLEGKKTF